MYFLEAQTPTRLSSTHLVPKSILHKGEVLVQNGYNIVGVYYLPKCAGKRDLHGDTGFLGYLNTRLPERYRREQIEYFKKEAEGLMRMRKSGHLPTIEPEIPR